MTGDDNETPIRRVDLGHGCYYSRIVDSYGNWVAIHEWHQCSANPAPGAFGDGTTAFFVAFDTSEARAVTTEQSPKWTVVSREPLTLSPSILCRACGHHGFIQSDRWVPA